MKYIISLAGKNEVEKTAKIQIRVPPFVHFFFFKFSKRLFKSSKSRLLEWASSFSFTWSSSPSSLGTDGSSGRSVNVTGGRCDGGGTSCRSAGLRGVGTGGGPLGPPLSRAIKKNVIEKILQNEDSEKKAKKSPSVSALMRLPLTMLIRRRRRGRCHWRIQTTVWVVGLKFFIQKALQSQKKKIWLSINQ